MNYKKNYINMNRGGHPYDERAAWEASRDDVNINMSYLVNDKNKSFLQ